jgi:hypothetical protein
LLYIRAALHAIAFAQDWVGNCLVLALHSDDRRTQYSSLFLVAVLGFEQGQNLETLVKEEFAWQELLKAAMIELDPAKLAERIQAARVAIRRRIEELEFSDSADRSQERDAITDGLRSLQVLEQVEFRSVNQRETQTRPSSTREAS